ncbi:YybS family protein [Virgibacillus siamensis]|uniref:YybS family protein n=1 Tax=Virgibacillus siamensis TaxID=480071 RepID=UPI000984F6DC|nr:YybS family protein [Virgibacillus siamensis]
MNSKKLTDGAMLTALYIVLLLITLFVPIISVVAMFVLPVPVIIYASRYNWKPTAVMVGAILILSFLFTTFLSLPITVMTCLGGLMIGSAMHQQSTAYETWARGTIGFIVGLLFAFLFSQIIFDVNWIDELNAMLAESMQMSRDFMTQFGLAEVTQEEWDTLKKQVSMIANLLPVGLAIIAIIFAFISQWAAYKVINRLYQQRLGFPPFRTLRFPVALIWIYFLSLIVTFFDLDPSGTLYLAVNNIMWLTGILMTLQGFSFIFFYAHEKNISKALPISSVVLSLFFPFFLLYLVRLLGIIDIGFGLRDRIGEKDNK